MTNKEIVKSDVMSIQINEWAVLRNDQVQLTKRVQTMLVNGKKLTPAEVAALVNYSVTCDLNPFIGECYMIPGVGCIPGTAGFRRKGSEQLMTEANLNGTDWANYHLNYFPATHEEALFDEKAGDIAWKAVLTDTLTESRWLQQILNFASEMKKTFPEESRVALMEQAYQHVSEKPCWWAVGVVYGAERFSKQIYENNKPTGKYKPEMWDRNERAKKRAGKGTIKARFPGLNLNPAFFANASKEIIDAEFYDEPEITTEEPIDTTLLNSYADMMDYPSDEDLDGNQPEQQQATQQKSSTKPRNTASASRPGTPAQVKSTILNRVAEFKKNNTRPNEGQVSSLPQHFELLFAGTGNETDKRKSVSQWLLEKSSTKHFTPYESLAIRKWIGMHEIDGEWFPNADACKEAVACYDEALRVSGQQELDMLF